MELNCKTIWRNYTRQGLLTLVKRVENAMAYLKTIQVLLEMRTQIF